MDIFSFNNVYFFRPITNDVNELFSWVCAIINSKIVKIYPWTCCFQTMSNRHSANQNTQRKLIRAKCVFLRKGPHRTRTQHTVFRRMTTAVQKKWYNVWIIMWFVLNKTWTLNCTSWTQLSHWKLATPLHHI